MKNLFTLIALLFCVFCASAQTAEFGKAPATIDYSQFFAIFQQQTWKLENIILKEKYTSVQISIKINSNTEGYFLFPKNIYIAGDFGSLHPTHLYVGETQWELARPWHYAKDNKGRSIICTLLFPRVPAGISSITYCEPNFVTWKNIMLDNPDTEHTDWTQTSLKAMWKQQGCYIIEGIYQFISTNDKTWWGDYKPMVAVVKTDDGYDLIHIKGANNAVWREGDLKARFVPTAVRGLYKATTWYMDNKMENDDFFIKFDEHYLYIYENNKNITADFLKLYPADEAPMVEQRNTSPARSNIQQTQQQIKYTGSGLILPSTGIVVTNYHIINDAGKIEISIKDNNTITTYAAKLLCADKANDLALLLVEDDKFKGFEPIPYAISTNICDVGTSVFTMGYPLTNYMGEEVKITDGIISSKTGYEGDITTYQISAPIQPGNSGGPLFDKQGNLVGITNAGIMAANNVGYAIKASYLCNLMDSAPIAIKIPTMNTIAELSLPEQIKYLSKFVAYIIIK